MLVHRWVERSRRDCEKRASRARLSDVVEHQPPAVRREQTTQAVFQAPLPLAGVYLAQRGSGRRPADRPVWIWICSHEWNLGVFELCLLDRSPS